MKFWVEKYHQYHGGSAQRFCRRSHASVAQKLTPKANNLTTQVRNIAEVTIAVANRILSRKITVDVRGEILQLKETINTMVEQLRLPSSKSRVSRARSAPKVVSVCKPLCRASRARGKI